MTMTTTPNTDDLRARLLADPEAFADAVLRGLTAAGAEREWDSGTIELVLDPIQGYLKRCSLPLVGDDDEGNTRYWRRIADECGIGYRGDGDEDEEV